MRIYISSILRDDDGVVPFCEKPFSPLFLNLFFFSRVRLCFFFQEYTRKRLSLEFFLFLSFFAIHPNYKHHRFDYVSSSFPLPSLFCFWRPH